MLTDSAQAVDGKLYILGGGWNVTGPVMPPFGIAVLMWWGWKWSKKAGQPFVLWAAAPLIILDPVTVTYDRTAHPVAAAATGIGGVPVDGSFTVTYAPGGDSVPVNPGTYAATVLFQSRDPNYTDACASTTVTINRHKTK